MCSEGFGRIYRLTAPGEALRFCAGTRGISCLIAEEFAESVLELPGKQQAFPGILGVKLSLDS